MFRARTSQSADILKGSWREQPYAGRCFPRKGETMIEASIYVGKSELDGILFYAFRYALGRKSISVSFVSGVLRKYWKELKLTTRATIKEEIQQAIKENRAGDECDRTEWELLLGDVRPKPQLEFEAETKKQIRAGAAEQGYELVEGSFKVHKK